MIFCASFRGHVDNADGFCWGSLLSLPEFAAILGQALDRTSDAKLSGYVDHASIVDLGFPCLFGQNKTRTSIHGREYKAGGHIAADGQQMFE